MVSEKREFSMGHTYVCAFFPTKAGLTKKVVIHKGALSKEVLLYHEYKTT